uniref:hypothetical protein n=1 Tax=Segnochrobactrum spirostomi TaxID=2608987 RepID=UPI001FE5A7C8|nr:hypothetical protein [Segnochrobactrum spirostomi]
MVLMHSGSPKGAEKIAARVIGMDIHRTFGEVVSWDEGQLTRGGRVHMTRTAQEGFGKGLRSTDEVVIEATGNGMAVSRVLSPFAARVVIANPLCRSRRSRTPT